MQRPSGLLPGELEITDLNKIYLEKGKLNVITLGRGYAWLDTGTMDSLYEASVFVKSVETRAGIHISMPEEIAYANGWIDKRILLKVPSSTERVRMEQYLMKVVEERF